MSYDLEAAVLERYHAHFDAAQYNAIRELLDSNLYIRDDRRLIDGMNALQDTCLEVCGHPDFDGAWQRLAVFCGVNALSIHTVDAMRDFLRRFAAEDPRIDDFEATAKALLLAYRGLDDLKTATSHANGIHSWRGRVAYELLAAVDYLTQAAIHLLMHGDDAYIHEKLQSGLRRITGALYEAIHHSDHPALYNFKSTYFPSERDA
ncbi:MAG: hypothetical protein IAE80_18285 [Anaerolinea sp.]|nr:hypothetical protein [Anaerolinea sp.]